MRTRIYENNGRGMFCLGQEHVMQQTSNGDGTYKMMTAISTQKEIYDNERHQTHRNAIRKAHKCPEVETITDGCTDHGDKIVEISASSLVQSIEKTKQRLNWKHFVEGLPTLKNKVDFPYKHNTISHLMR